MANAPMFLTFNSQETRVYLYNTRGGRQPPGKINGSSINPDNPTILLYLLRLFVRLARHLGGVRAPERAHHKVAAAQALRQKPGFKFFEKLMLYNIS